MGELREVATQAIREGTSKYPSLSLTSAKLVRLIAALVGATSLLKNLFAVEDVAALRRGSHAKNLTANLISLGRWRVIIELNLLILRVI